MFCRLSPPFTAPPNHFPRPKIPSPECFRTNQEYQRPPPAPMGCAKPTLSVWTVKNQFLSYFKDHSPSTLLVGCCNRHYFLPSFPGRGHKSIISIKYIKISM